MTTTTSNATKPTGKAIVNKAKHVATNRWVEQLVRFGFVIRGLIYITIGVLALQLAIGAGGATKTPTSAIALMGQQPLGKFLLIIVVVGLAGYSLWGFMRAILDPLGRGTKTKGLLFRADYLLSGVSYAAILFPTVLVLLNMPGGSASGNTAGLPTALLTGPFGKWLIAAFGFFWIVAGVAQLVVAYKALFTHDLDTGAMSAQELKTATWVGRIGFAARGVVFGLIGLIIFQTTFLSGQQAQGFDGALVALAHAPYGEVLLGIVATGLILFGVYSALCAKWNRFGAR